MDVRERVIEAIARIAGREPSSIKDSDLLEEDLGLDSLDRVELVMALEEETGLEVEDQETEQVRTVGEVIEFVERLLNAGV